MHRVGFDNHQPPSLNSGISDRLDHCNSNLTHCLDHLKFCFAFTEFQFVDIGQRLQITPIDKRKGLVEVRGTIGPLDQFPVHTKRGLDQTKIPKYKKDLDSFINASQNDSSMDSRYYSDLSL